MKYTAKDFKSDQEVRWCPGCGDHALLASLQRALPVVADKLGYKKEDFVFISGIGCSSRAPYYVDTFGFHSIHGRAIPISTGIKVSNPKLSLWVATGDGDALAIGGNHFIHGIRRNIDLNVILFNNQIYGLTKGQYSPTSPIGKITNTSPYGTVEYPFNPGSLVMGARGTFFSRSIDVDIKLTQENFIASALHAGCSINEVLVNCMIYNNGAHKAITDKEVREDRTIILRQGEPMIFGKNRDKGIMLDRDSITLKVVKLGENGITEKDLLVHDSHNNNIGIHNMLIDMKYPEFPVALGVIRDVKDITYDSSVQEQVDKVKAESKIKCVDDILHSGSTWEVN
ncbi:MAG: 2-oxoacid:ferredoxin oxidoreductase subunit beta [Bacteroidales bacterium]